jgi:hypothetical protein
LNISEIKNKTNKITVVFKAFIMPTMLHGSHSTYFPKEGQS